MDKGTRVTITGGGKGVGMHGIVFWKGPNKWGAGERLGVRADDGETYWVQDADVEEATGAPPPPEGPRFEKGDRVAFEVGGRAGTGTVFWVGENRHGPGQRLGVRDDTPPADDDAVWLDARQAKPLSGEERTPAPDDEEEGVPPEYAVSLAELPPAPPLSDDEVETWAATADEDVDEPLD